MSTTTLPSLRRRVFLPILAGILGAAFLAGVYLGIVSLAESPDHARELFWQDRFFVIPILVGFGVQAGLFTLLKTGIYMPMRNPSGGAITSAGGGLSTVAMAACCAHHLVEVLPLVGLTAAAAFLAAWKIPFLIAGLFTNVLGIAVMIRIILRERRRTIFQLPLTSMEAIA